MEDRYLNYQETLNRLVSEYKKYDSLFVAFDFDNTVFDFHNVSDTFPKIEQLLIDLKAVN